ncbi:MAG: diguanylate cyclase [Syntrophales bacterium]|nr:diguanylate cyclase [Syntrophales bacterium]
MKLNLLTLKFSGDSSALEGPFLSDYWRGSLFHIRISLILGALLYAAFGGLDAFLMPEQKYTMWLIRLIVVCPALLGLLLTSFLKSFEQYMQPLLAGGLILAGGGIVCMIVIAPVPGQDIHVTVSIGLAQYKTQEEMKTFIHRADQFMYQGKRDGKDRVCCEP